MKNTKMRILVSLPFFIFFFLSCALLAHAFESTSVTFELHAGDIENVVASSTSASFKLHNAGGQNAIASSSVSVRSISSGILYWLYGFFTARYTQTHFRWRADDGTEVTATFPIAEDTEHISFSKNVARRLRIEISNEGWTRGTAPSFRLEFAELSSGSDCANGPFTTGYVAVPTNYSLAMHLSTSTQITIDPTATTNFAGSLTDENITFVPGEVKTTGNTTSAITLGSDKFTEVEYGVSATSLATNGARYCFRVTDSGSTTNMVYTFSGQPKYATAIVSSGLPVTGSLDSAVFDTTGVAQGPAYNSIMWNGTIEGTGKVRFQLATSDSPSGPWNFFGSSDGGVTCNSGSYYDTLTSGTGGGPGKPVEISCAPSQAQNNKRYYKYRIQICSADCSASGATSPVVTGVVVNWAP